MIFSAQTLFLLFSAVKNISRKERKGAKAQRNFSLFVCLNFEFYYLNFRIFSAQPPFLLFSAVKKIKNYIPVYQLIPLAMPVIFSCLSENCLVEKLP